MVLIETGQTIKSFDKKFGITLSIAIKPSNDYLFIANYEKVLFKVSINEWRVVKTTQVNGCISSMMISNDGRFLYIGAENGLLIKYCTRDDCILKTHKLEDNVITSIVM